MFVATLGSMWITYTLIGTLLWAVVNVGNSTLVARYFKSPFFLLWVQTVFSMIILAVIAFLYPVWTPWMPLLLLGSAVAYVGDLLLFWILDRLDVSVMNATWAILAIFMSIVGFFFFKETWTLQQTAGAVFVVFGIFLLSFYHSHRSLPKTIGLLSLFAFLYVPAYALRKAALVDGAPFLPVVFWLIFGRDVISFVSPIFVRKMRVMLVETLPQCTPGFFVISALVICSFYGAELTITRAYMEGPVSLISVIGNVQPFFVMLLAAPLTRWFPSVAPRELLSFRSTVIKTASFSIVFVGLALLSASQ